MDNALPISADRRPLIDTAFRGGLAVALYVVFPAFSDIFRLWARQAGHVPGWPQEAFEYPAIGALYFAPFGLLPSGRWAVLVNGLIMVGASVAITWLLMRSAKTTGRPSVDIQMWVASPALLLFLPINWDILVTLLALLGIVGLYESRVVLSGFWNGVGTAFKIFPGAMMLPVLPLIEGWRRRVSFLASGAGVVIISYLAYAATDPEGWRFHLDFAPFRTDTQSTIWGILQRILEVFDVFLPISAVNTMSAISLILALFAFTYWTARTKPTFAQAATVAVLALLTFNKVFKPQYVLWVLPFLAWLGVSRLKVRVLEGTAIMQFAVIYFALPAFLYVVEASVRLLVLALLMGEIMRTRSVTMATREP